VVSFALNERNRSGQLRHTASWGPEFYRRGRNGDL
jgi:hypothetical protein